MICGFVGWVGSGKTLGMIDMAVSEFRRRRCQVFTNMAGVRIPGAVYIDSLEGITSVSKGLILLDEAGVCMSSRFWQKVPREVLMSLAQVRKHGLDLFWTSQHEARVDTVLRENTHQVVRCRRVARWSQQRIEDPSAKVVLGSKWLPLKPRLFALYDTLEVIGIDGSGGHSGPVGGRLEVPQTVRPFRDAPGAVPKPLDALLGAPAAVRWYDGQWRLTRAGREARDWLVARELLGPRTYDWVGAVRREVRRRAWLRVFGLSVEDVPAWCSPERPWAEGWSPADVAERRWLLEVAEAEETLRIEKRRRAG